jgi:hypothetical protein
MSDEKTSGRTANVSLAAEPNSNYAVEENGGISAIENSSLTTGNLSDVQRSSPQLTKDCAADVRITREVIADQQQPEVAPRRQARSADLVGVESLAEIFDVPVEVMFVENPIQS